MATLNTLKVHLKRTSTAAKLSARQPLSHAQYSAGFDILAQGPGWMTYQDFIVPQLSLLLAPLLHSRIDISVLEIGPGPKSVLGYLPEELRRGIRRYAAFEPDGAFAARLEEWVYSTSETGLLSPFPCLECPSTIHRKPFDLDSNTVTGGTRDVDEKFDLILFCHSMYGMNPKSRFIERALNMLEERRDGGGMVVVFHREGTLQQLDNLTCHRMASFPTGVTRVADEDEILDRFAAFIAGFVMLDRDGDVDRAVQAEWREVCRTLGRRDDTGTTEAEAHHHHHHPGHLVFGSPIIMAAFTQHAAIMLPELLAQVPLLKEGDRATVKNPEARRHRAASIVRPTEVRHVQQCVRWAIKHRVGLTVVSGSHSGHCLWPNVVAVDMGAFDQIHILKASGEDGPGEGGGGGGGGGGEGGDSSSVDLVIVGAGCRTGEIVRETMAAGLTVPLGSRPSVGTGLWLQGGLGHLARLYGLACDAIVGAVVVRVDSGEILCLGLVPTAHRPAGARSVPTVTRPQVCDGNETQTDDDLLWAIKGAGTNFGIVISVTFKAFAAPTYRLRTWLLPLSNSQGARRKLTGFDAVVASQLPRSCSADAYLYWDAGHLQLGVTVLEASIGSTKGQTTFEIPTSMRAFLGPEHDHKVVDGIGLFGTEMYVSEMHNGGHGGGKTSSFKRCVFLKHIGAGRVTDVLVAAIETRPSPLCYLHLLHGGGAACEDVASDATAFGCRDWDFACVVTGVWPRKCNLQDLDHGHDQDHETPDTLTAQAEAEVAAVRWVYSVVRDLLAVKSNCVGVYGADLGPDPRDAALAAVAFGPNWPRLARLKRTCDPHNILAYACPLPGGQESQSSQKLPALIILVTGESGAGKDYCASIWVDVFNNNTAHAAAATCLHNKHDDKNITARAVSISDATKREYAAATGADLTRLLGGDREYKEQHRPALTLFFERQVQQRPRLLEEHFLDVVYGAARDDHDHVDVLFITGMREEAPVAGLSHLIAGSRLLEVRVTASEDTRHLRRGGGCHRNERNDTRNGYCGDNSLDYSPSLVFDNDGTGTEAATKFAKQCLLPFSPFQPDLQRLAKMARRFPDFPRAGIEFRHVLDIAQQPGGLALCTSLLQAHVKMALRRGFGDGHHSSSWAHVDAVACCEAGGFVFASALVAQIGVPILALIRNAGKLPPPTVSARKPQSHISSFFNKAPRPSSGSSVGEVGEKRIEMGRDVIPSSSSAVVVVVDDVLATGETLCAVLQLLVGEVGIRTENISIMVVAEFPLHRGRELLRRHGFGKVKIHSLLVFAGV